MVGLSHWTVFFFKADLKKHWTNHETAPQAYYNLNPKFPWLRTWNTKMCLADMPKCWPSDWSFYATLDCQYVTRQRLNYCRSLIPKLVELFWLSSFEEPDFFLLHFFPSKNMIESWFLNCISITNHKQNIAYSSRSLCVFSDIFPPFMDTTKAI